MKNIKYKIVDDLNVADKIMKNTFWIGVYPGLTEPMIDFMIESIDEFMRLI